MKIAAKIATGIALLSLAAPVFAAEHPVRRDERGLVTRHDGRMERKSARKHFRHVKRHGRHGYKTAAGPSFTHVR